MSHEHAQDLLDDFVGGELPEHERLAVQAHLDDCAERAADAHALRTLLDEAAALPRGIAPPRDLWSGIAGRLEPRGTQAGAEPRDEAAERKVDTKVIPLFPRPARNPRWLQAAAAVALVALSSAVTAKVVRQHEQVAVDGRAPTLAPLAATQPAVRGGAAGDVPSAVPVDAGTKAPVSAPAPEVRLARQPARAAAPVTALAAFRPAEREYQRATDDLERLLRTQRGRMAPATAATLERNLRIIDQAIAESREALRKDPNNRELAQMLGAVYDTKIQTLQRAVSI
jgi:hypothetical protein